MCQALWMSLNQFKLLILESPCFHYFTKKNLTWYLRLSAFSTAPWTLFQPFSSVSRKLIKSFRTSLKFKSVHLYPLYFQAHRNCFDLLDHLSPSQDESYTAWHSEHYFKSSPFYFILPYDNHWACKCHGWILWKTKCDTTSKFYSQIFGKHLLLWIYNKVK